MITREELLKLLTVEDIIEIMKDLGTDYKTVPSNNNQLYFRTVCHCGNKYKLLFYKDSKLFQCLTECGTISIFDIIMGAKDWEFKKAYEYVLNFKGITNNSSVRTSKGITIGKIELEDTEFLEKHLSRIEDKHIELPTYDKGVMRLFSNYYPSVWEDEGLSVEEMEVFDVKMYFNQMRAILPHKNVNGDLIGIRGRAFFQKDIDDGKKYMPITIQGLTYRHPTGLTLYGLYENINNIKRLKKCIIFEGEKSVIKYGSYFGRESNIALATLGTNISSYQRKTIVDLVVEEVIVAYDKQYMFSLIEKGDKKAIKEYNGYIKKMIKIYKLFCGYCNLSIIFCDNDEDLDYKDAPIDKGKERFIELRDNRITIEDISELESELIEV